jgi:hypothetical protein
MPSTVCGVIVIESGHTDNMAKDIDTGIVRTAYCFWVKIGVGRPVTRNLRKIVFVKMRQPPHKHPAGESTLTNKAMSMTPTSSAGI